MQSMFLAGVDHDDDDDDDQDQFYAKSIHRNLSITIWRVQLSELHHNFPGELSTG